jgi:tetratricopeptide (TPR) repeat protein
VAELAEKLSRFKLAEQLYRQLAALPTAPLGKLVLAAFLGRRHQVKEALDICEPLWPNAREPERVAAACIKVLFAPGQVPDRAQLNRVAGWLEGALKQQNPAQNQQSTQLLLLSLASVYERQGQYEEAKALYRRVAKEGDRDGTSCNNLAWLMAFEDGKGRDALAYINRAIALKGPQPDFLDTRGVIYLNMGESQRAINDLEDAVARAPSPSKFFHLAQACLKAGDKKKTTENWAKTKGLKPSDPSDLHALEVKAYQKMLNELGPP